MPRKVHDLTGRRFDTQLVIRRADDRIWEGEAGSRRVVYWLVYCGACGKTREVQGTTLKRGTRCPCQNKKTARKMERPPGPAKMTNQQLVMAVRRRLGSGVEMSRYNEIMQLVEELYRRVSHE